MAGRSAWPWDRAYRTVVAGWKSIPHAVQALSSSPWAHWAAYGAGAGRGDAAQGGVAPDTVNVVDAGGAEDAAAGRVAAVADRNCACWVGRENAAAGR